jgi:hypothetical protein
MAGTGRSNPLGVFADRFNSLEEVVQTVRVDAGNNEYMVEVCKKKHPNDPHADHFVIHYFVKRGNQYVDDDTGLPWADGHTKDGALAEALGFIEDKYPRKTRKVEK